MKICFALWHLNGYRGTQTWTVAAARAMKALGHEVSLYCVERGRAAARLMPEFPVYSMSHVGEVPKQDVLVVAQPRMFLQCRQCHRHVGDGQSRFRPDLEGFAQEHTFEKHACSGSGMKMKRVLPTAAQKVYVCHGVMLWQDGPLKDRTAYVAVSEETQGFLKEHGIDSVIVRQPVDLDHYTPGPPLRYTNPRALTFSQAPAQLDAIKAACDDTGFELVEPPEGELWDVRDLINSVDVVIGSGRGLCEAMATGRGAIVCSRYGCDGLVTPDSIDELLTHNFSGRARADDIEDTLGPALNDFGGRTGQWSEEMARERFDARKNVAQIVEAAC